MPKFFYDQKGRKIEDPYLDENDVPKGFPDEIPSYGELFHANFLRWRIFWLKSSIRKLFRYQLLSEIFILTIIYPIGIIASNFSKKWTQRIRTNADIMFFLDSLEAESAARRWYQLVSFPRKWE